MKSALRAIMICSAAVSMAPAAQAADYLIVPATPSYGYTFSVVCAGGCFFTDFISFLTPAGFNLAGADSATIFNNTVGTNIDFGKAPGDLTLNGVDFLQGSLGNSDHASVSNVALVAGPTLNVLKVSGHSDGNATYAGNIVFAFRSAVPEPKSWLMMLLGFGVVGFGMRRSPQFSRRVNYSFRGSDGIT